MSESEGAASRFGSLRRSTDPMRILAALVLLLPTLLSAQESSESSVRLLSPSIAACIDAIDELVIGIENLEEHCPCVEQALDEAGLEDYLSEEQLDVLTPYHLNDLEQLLQRYSSAETTGVATLDQLAPILEQLRKPPEADVPLTWFERLKRWLRDLLNRNEENPDNWLSRWLQDLDVPQAVTRGILYGSIAAIIALAIAVVINELRAAGVLRGGPRRDRVASGKSVSNEQVATASLDELGLRDRPAVLLQRLVLTLVRSGRLRAERSLTHRELGLRAKFDAQEQRQRFEQVALLGERLVYGDGTVPDEDIDRVVRDGRALELELSHADARP